MRNESSVLYSQSRELRRAWGVTMLVVATLLICLAGSPSPRESASQDVLRQADYSLIGYETVKSGLTAPGAPAKMTSLFESTVGRAFLMSSWPDGTVFIQVDTSEQTPASELVRRLQNAVEAGKLSGAVSGNLIVRRGSQVLRWKRGSEQIGGIIEMDKENDLYEENFGLVGPVSLMTGRTWLEPRLTLRDLVQDAELVETRQVREEESGLECDLSRYEGEVGTLEVWSAQVGNQLERQPVRLRLTKRQDDLFRGEAVGSDQSMKRYLPELRLQQVVHDVGATEWITVDYLQIPSEGFTRTEFVYDDGRTVMWSRGTFRVTWAEAASAASLAESLVSELDDGARVHRLDMETGGVAYEWRDGSIQISTDPAATAQLERAIAAAQGDLAAQRRMRWLWIGSGLILVLGAVAVVLVILRSRRTNT